MTLSGVSTNELLVEPSLYFPEEDELPLLLLALLLASLVELDFGMCCHIITPTMHAINITRTTMHRKGRAFF
jgi:hypothetical protein